MDNNKLLLVAVVAVIAYLLYSNCFEKLDLDKLTPCQVSVLELDQYKYADGNPEKIEKKHVIGYNASLTACKIRTGEK